VCREARNRLSAACGAAAATDQSAGPLRANDRFGILGAFGGKMIVYKRVCGPGIAAGALATLPV